VERVLPIDTSAPFSLRISWQGFPKAELIAFHKHIAIIEMTFSQDEIVEKRPVQTKVSYSAAPDFSKSSMIHFSITLSDHTCLIFQA